jgi:lipopolysaccharide/colanic/teichoic acid biosynthesis glycosyltransferase
MQDIDTTMVAALDASEQPVFEGRSAGGSLQPIAKTAFDLSMATLAVTALSIPTAILAIWIKLDSPGPVFFKQPRVGKDNKTFICWKFRTMRNDRADINGDQLTQKNDPRITKIGAFLRKTSLDELPQLINVLRGEMSLVGPRPHPLSAKAAGRPYREVVPGYDRRHVLLPGITGWAQVNGWRGETETERQIEQRVAFDLEYIERQSFLFDLRIIFKTLASEIRSKTAF